VPLYYALFIVLDTAPDAGGGGSGYGGGGPMMLHYSRRHRGVFAPLLMSTVSQGRACRANRRVITALMPRVHYISRHAQDSRLHPTQLSSITRKISFLQRTSNCALRR